MPKITIVDIQHKQFKKKLNGYDPSDVDQYLDEIIETLEDEAHGRAALEAEISDLRERISHFKSMEESLQNTLLLAQRTADEVKAHAHKEADLIRHEARLGVEKEIASLADRATAASASTTGTRALRDERSDTRTRYGSPPGRACGPAKRCTTHSRLRPNRVNARDQRA